MEVSRFSLIRGRLLELCGITRSCRFLGVVSCPANGATCYTWGRKLTTWRRRKICWIDSFAGRIRVWGNCPRIDSTPMWRTTTCGPFRCTRTKPLWPLRRHLRRRCTSPVATILRASPRWIWWHPINHLLYEQKFNPDTWLFLDQFLYLSATLSCSILVQMSWTSSQILSKVMGIIFLSELSKIYVIF